MLFYFNYELMTQDRNIRPTGSYNYIVNEVQVNDKKSLKFAK